MFTSISNVDKEETSTLESLKIDARLMHLRPVQQSSLVQSASSSRGSMDPGMLDENAAPFLLVKNVKRRSLFRPDDKNTMEVLAALLQQQKASRPLYLLKNHALARDFDKIKTIEKKPKPFRSQSMSSINRAPSVEFSPIKDKEEHSVSKLSKINIDVNESNTPIDISITKLLTLLNKYVVNFSGSQSEIKIDQTWNVARKKSILFVLQTLALFKFNCFKEEYPPVMKFLIDYNPKV